MIVRRRFLATSLLFPSLQGSWGLQNVVVPSLALRLAQRFVVKEVFPTARRHHRGVGGAVQRHASTHDKNDYDNDPPFTWTELQDIVTTGRLDQLKRSQTHQRSYDRHKIDILNDYQTPYDFILFEKFGLERTLNKESGTFVVKRPGPGQVLTALAENSFPYHVGDKVCHWVLWKLGGDCADEDVKQAEQELGIRIPQALDFLHWRNPPPLQSLPDIDHIHILVLTDSK